MLLVYLRAANFEFPVPFESEYGTRLKEFFKVDNVTETAVQNEKFVYFEYGNANIFTNFEDIGFTLLHSFTFCMIILAIKAIYQILVFNFNYKEAFMNEGGKEEKTLKEKMKVFTMDKLRDQSRDFKYNFFI